MSKKDFVKNRAEYSRSEIIILTRLWENKNEETDVETLANDFYGEFKPDNWRKSILSIIRNMRHKAINLDGIRIERTTSLGVSNKAKFKAIFPQTTKQENEAKN